MGAKGFRVLKILLSASILIALIYFLRLDLSEISFSLNPISGILALLLLSFSLLFRSYRWLLINNYYLRSSIGMGAAIRYLFIGSALNIILPSGSGDVMKGYIAEKENNENGTFVFASLYDKIIAIASLFPLALLALFGSGKLIFLLAGCISLIPLLLIHIIEFDPIKEKLNSVRLFKKLFEKHRSRIESTRIKSYPLILKSVFLSICGWLLTYILLFLCFEAVDAQIPLLEVLDQCSILTLGRLFPFTLNGIGTDEALMIYLFQGKESAILAGALLYRLILILLPAIIGLVLLNTHR